MIRPTLLILALLFCSTIARGEWESGGQFRALAVSATEGEDIPPHHKMFEMTLRSELTRLEDRFPGFEFALDLSARNGDPPLTTPLRDTSFEHTTIDNFWENSYALDRFKLHRSGSRYDLTLGRQAIGFGRMVLISPLDLIAPFPPDAINADHRPGVDALRLSLYDQRGDSLGLIGIRADERDQDSLLATGVLLTPVGDLLLLAGGIRGGECYGAGLAGEVAGIGVRGEYAACDVPQEGMIKRGGVELWWHGENNLDLLVAWLHNGLADDPADYPAAALSAPIREGVTTLLGNDYLLASAGYLFHPLVEGNLLVIRNQDDASVLVQPRLTLSLGDNLAALLFASFPRGKEPEQQQFLPFPLPRSEFGSRSERYGIQLTYSF